MFSPVVSFVLGQSFGKSAGLSSGARARNGIVAYAMPNAIGVTLAKVMADRQAAALSNQARGSTSPGDKPAPPAAASASAAANSAAAASESATAAAGSASAAASSAAAAADSAVAADKSATAAAGSPAPAGSVGSQAITTRRR